MELPFSFKVSYLLLPAESMFLVLMMVPALVYLYPLARAKSTPDKPNVSRIGYLFTFLITLSNLMAITGFLFSITFLKFSVLFSNLCMISVFLVTQRNPDYQRLLRSITRKHQYEKSQIKGLNISLIVERLVELMEDEKIFAVEDLTLGNLAGELGISGHQLSEILNREMKKNFSTFINEYRIREAKQLLLEYPGRSILAIGISAGFNSATTFNAAFLKAEGITPGKYRKIKTDNKN
jgi:AraC-like DNA-binding protein